MIGSLKRRLTVILLGLTLLTWLVSVIVTAYSAGQLMVRQIDRHLHHYADMAGNSLTAFLEDPNVQSYFRARAGRVSVEPNSDLRRVRSITTPESGNAVNFWFGDSHILVGEQAPMFPAPTNEGVINIQVADGSHWRVLYRNFPKFNVWQAVGVDMKSAREGGVATFWRGVIPLLVVLPVTIMILFFGVRKGLQPINVLAAQISARKPHSLEPLEAATAPTELKPVVISLNGLLERLERALASEQRFTANAAHELQTPLAAIQAAVQGCQRQVAGMSECGDVHVMLNKISQRINSATVMVRQLLTLARLDPDQEFEHGPVDVGVLVEDTMAEIGNLGMERQLTVHFDDRSHAVIQGNIDWLRILLRNVFSNAFKYSPVGGDIEVVIDQSGGHTRLTVANDCEAIPAHELERLTERFYHPSTGSDHGAGLGLSIVQRIAELHKARLFIHSPQHASSLEPDGLKQASRGFKIEVHFPPVL